MSGKINLEQNLNEVDVTPDVAAIVGNRTDAVLAWYRVAKDNLSTADLLLDNKHIPHAIFFIQQCVECLVKGTFLECGALNEETTRQISHSPDKAYKALYEQINYEIGLYYCREIPRQLNNGKSFEDKLKIGASIANQFTKHYWEDLKNSPFDAPDIPYINSSAMGLEDGADQLSCHIRYLESMYDENMLLLFSCVFSHDVEQNVRYPIINNDKITLPIDNFYTPIIEDGLKTTIPVLRTILNSIVGNSVL